jgi:hypothetical protein
MSDSFDSHFRCTRCVRVHLRGGACEHCTRFLLAEALDIMSSAVTCYGAHKFVALYIIERMSEMVKKYGDES